MPFTLISNVKFRPLSMILSKKYDFFIISFVSNGFKQREGGAGWGNASGGTYVYMAFAEHPFVTSDGVPTTAR